ncbi:Endonuclease, Uma2 family (restriction endonuclease fold) [Streptomyces sp. SceaMP-e96]|uniref:Uma2 family endonuclease n=1 Tax=unclassified Streptomyces TaxID=2593676 RepID=UPI000823E169|nr:MULTISPECIES: Uma2 family endonuclease [unclassified Streptomyces]SCK37424.1 Endonuclease, Uma2 family (restriction endonuclease fold) [Streptomyces sp. SceaMP-e96]
MTAVDERRMTELFENLEVPEGIKMELLRGEIVMMAGPDLVHNEIVEAVQDQIPRSCWRRLQTQDIAILSESSEPQPDLAVLERGVGPHSGRLLPSEMVTMLVEVVSKNSVERDYGIKRSIYAAGKVPAYLIIDPIVAHCVLLTEPVGGGDEADYTVQRITKFGDPVPLELLGIELESSEFGILPNVRPHRRP